MKGFMDLLVKAKLIEPSEQGAVSPSESIDVSVVSNPTGEVDAEVPVSDQTNQAEETSFSSPPVADRRLSSGPAPRVVGTSFSSQGQKTPPPTEEVVIGQVQPIDFEEVYGNAKLVVAKYPAEKMLRLLDGLSAMDAATRLVAIQAMDAADDTWTIQDPLADAQRKVAVLQHYQEQVHQQLASMSQETLAKKDQIKLVFEKRTQEIRTQISQLEGLLNRESDKMQQETSKLEQNLLVLKSQVEQQDLQVKQEVARLHSLQTLFAPELSQSRPPPSLSVSTNPKN